MWGTVVADDKNTGVVTTCDLIPNLGEAIEFLKGWGIAEPVLSASHTEPGTGKKGLFESHQFKLPFSWDDVQAWIAARQRNGNWSNIYFNVNPAHSGVDKKMDRSDIGAMVALHVDADAAPMPQDFKEGGAAWQAQEIVRLTKLLQNYKHPPSDIIISGGGVQGYWRLKDPEPVNGDVTIAEDLKLYNKGLERDLGTDATHNLDRVMRVPGTVNIPTASKLPKGRVPALSRVYSHTAVTYDLGQFEKAPPDAVPELKGLEAGGRYIDAGQFERIASNDGRLVNLERPWLRLGMEGDYDGKFTGLDGKCDRSRMALAFVTQCIRAGIEDGVIASIIMDANWKVGECIRDKAGETKRQLKRLLERAHKFVNEDVTKPAFLGLETWGSTANKFLIRKCPDLAYWNGDFYNYRNGVYKIYEDAYVHSMVRMFLDESVCSGGEDKPPIPFNPNNNDVNETLGFVKDKCYLPRDAMTPPCYRFEDPSLPRARDCLNLRNCILHVPTGATAEHTPDFFTTSISDYDFDPLADCPIWKKVLNDWWPPCDDGTVPMEQMLLQEMIGYSLLPRTDLQKMFCHHRAGRLRQGHDSVRHLQARRRGQRHHAVTRLADADLVRNHAAGEQDDCADWRGAVRAARRPHVRYQPAQDRKRRGQGDVRPQEQGALGRLPAGPVLVVLQFHSAVR
jgi:hypothetical protein